MGLAGLEQCSEVSVDGQACRRADVYTTVAKVLGCQRNACAVEGLRGCLGDVVNTASLRNVNANSSATDVGRIITVVFKDDRNADRRLDDQQITVGDARCGDMKR